RVGGRLEASVFQITVKSSLVNRHDRAQAHRDGGKFPKIGHQPRMRIRGQPTAGLKFAAEIFQLLSGQTALDKCPRIYAWRSVPLKINRVAFKFFVARAEKMIESYFEEGRDRTIGRDVTSDIVLDAIGPDHHGKGVPAHQAFDFSFDFLVAREGGLLARGNRVEVRRIRRKR